MAHELQNITKVQKVVEQINRRIYNDR